jgi:uncharacterized membrane protein YbhN (UPF0104 family)
MALLALRWRLTAGRLGIALPFRTALSEYWLGVFLNQLLPGGVMGDLSRAWRHARSAPAPALRNDLRSGAPVLGPAVRAVILERASAQVVMGAVTVLALASTPLAFGATPGTLLLALLGVAGAGTLAVWAGRGRLLWGSIEPLWRDAKRALLAPDVVWIQLGTAALAVASYLATYLVAARAVGVDTPFGTLLPLVPPVLVSMLVPVTVAGWGVREATAAGVWSAVGLRAEDAVAISACYGVLVLLGSLPGALVLLSAGRDRRAGRRPGGSGGSGDEGPRPALRSEEG